MKWMSWPGVFLLVFHGVGVTMLATSLWTVRRSLQASSWPTTPGKLTHVELNERHDESVTYEVRVAYTYTVDGRQYHGDRLAFGYGGSSGCELHRPILERLQSGATVLVRYNPDNPSQATLSYGLHRSLCLGIVLSITWILLTAAFTFVVWISTQPDTVLLENLLVR